VKNLVITSAAAAAALLLVGVAPAHRDLRSGQELARSSAATINLRNTRFGRVLFDARGQALYAFTRDRRGQPSRCYGGCTQAWPVYYAKGALRVGPGLRHSLLGTTRRRNGRLQITYNGWPLYFYAHEGPREVTCQNVREFGGLWLVVRANGMLVR
jgi:predicted lipoprotein with Yx(FWY)xxD motif